GVGHRALGGNPPVGTSPPPAAPPPRPRRWFALWQGRPPFAPYTFRPDLARISALYRSRGYYHAEVRDDVVLPAEGDVVQVTVTIEEGTPVKVTDVDLAIDGATLSTEAERRLRTGLPLKAGEVFEEDRYERGRSALRDYFRQRGHARVTVEKSARVNVRDDSATVRYAVDTGPECTFGPITITGVEDVDRDVVQREIAFK